MSSISIPAEVPIEAVPEPAAPVASATNVVRRSARATPPWRRFAASRSTSPTDG